MTIHLKQQILLLPPRFIGLIPLLTAALLAGCGGDNDTDANAPVDTPANTAPIATAVTLSTSEDTPVNGMLNASDADRDPLTYSIVDDGSMGAAVIVNSSTGAFTYTPNSGESGSDQITYKATDGKEDSNIATVTISIGVEANTAPTASPVSLSTNKDTAVNGVLNASDVDGDPLTYSIVDNGSRGTAVILDTSTGDFTYTPNPGEFGSDQITFKANDGKVDSNVETVTLSVIEMNKAPVASGGCSATFQSATLSGTLSATDPDADLLMFSLNADGSGGSGPITTTMGGVVTLIDPTTGVFSYKPSTVKGGIRRGKDSFAFQIRDPGGLTDNTTEEVIVNQTIMPLGDSITEGVGDGASSSNRAGFRKSLFNQLKNSGFTFDFVGSLNNGSGFDKNHQGHSGWTANEIAWGKSGYPVDGVRVWLEDNPADFVLLHIGTNVTNASNDVDIESALNEIDLWEQSAQGNPVTVILALIVDKNPISAVVSAFNQNVQTLANNRIANGDTIVIVNQQAALSYPSDLVDAVHPNSSGYAKMASVWFNALKNVIDKCP